MNWMCRKQRKVYKTVNYIKHFRVRASPITGCISIFAFVSLLGISLWIKSFAIGLKICATATGTKTFKSTIKKKKSLVK